jgi:hypothetical protein
MQAFVSCANFTNRKSFQDDEPNGYLQTVTEDAGGGGGTHTGKASLFEN